MIPVVRVAPQTRQARMRLACRLASLLAATVTVVSCRDTTSAAPPVLGTYVLISIAGEPLPSNIIATPVGLVFLARADTIVLATDGTARKREVGERVSGSGAPPGPYQTDEPLRFTVTEAGAIELSYVCDGAAVRADVMPSTSATATEVPRTLSCVAGPHFMGRLGDDELVITATNLGYRTPRRYRRVP
jgi:hypothetical protein